ncbi:thioredoxin family protein [Riemerella columbina]|uniref:thioredoxin family protein n=1 Tax=Riemerella columbina TaxID=103810 RepID=UPI000380B872|nr:thioredoxin family protein [Riemerella columbina]
MKRILSTFILASTLFFSLNSCGVTEKTIVNREVKSEKYGTLLLGKQTLSQFQKEPFKTWYDEEYANYETDKTTLALLGKSLNKYNLKVFVGTWCSDSHREFPRLIKILNESGYPLNKLTIIALSKRMESPESEEIKYHINRVPTIVLERYGREIGRIVEYPETGFLEQDLYNIVKRDGNIKKVKTKKAKKTKKVKKAKKNN